MSEILFNQQKVLFDRAMEEIKSGKKKILISGPSGCGKTFLSQFLCTKLSAQSSSASAGEVIHLRGDSHCPDRDYYPFQTGLNHLNEWLGRSRAIKASVAKTFDFLPVGGGFLEFVADAVLNRNGSANHKLNQIFGETEIDIILKIRNALTHDLNIIYLDNLHWWDTKSLELLYLIFKHMSDFLPELCNVTFICNITTDQHFEHKDQVSAFLDYFAFLDLAFSPFLYDEYCEILQELGLFGENYDDKVAKLLYAISEGHLEVTLKALSLPNSIKEVCHGAEPLDTQEGQYLRLLLEKKLSALGASGQQIDNVLKFGALLGLSFTYLELERITEYGQAELRTIINRANKISLLEVNQIDCQFSHEIIREFFRQKALEQNEGYYYDRLIKCYKELYPTEYKLRIRYLLLAGNLPEIEKLYCLDIIAQLENGTVSRDPNLEILISSEIKDYLDAMATCWTFYRAGKYDQAYETLNQVEDLYPIELLAKRDYLFAIVLTRNLRPSDCDLSYQVLSVYEEKIDEFTEQQIWSHLMLLLFATFLHVGLKDECRRIQKKLYGFYSLRASISAVFRRDLNVLRRKSIAIYELETSLGHLEKSVQFFQPNGENPFPTYPSQYLMSLVNYNANLICFGHFEESYKAIIKAIMLTQSLLDISFPRTEVAHNNLFLSCYFTKRLSVGDVIGLFESLLSDLPDIADRTIIKTNLSIFYVKAGEFDKAEGILMGLRSDLMNANRYEPSYLYHVEANLVALYVCKGDWSEAEVHLKPLEQLIPHAGRSSYYKKKHDILLDIVQKQISTQSDHDNIILERCPTFQTNAWNFFGRLFAYNTLEYWSEA